MSQWGLSKRHGKVGKSVSLVNDADRVHLYDSTTGGCSCVQWGEILHNFGRVACCHATFACHTDLWSMGNFFLQSEIDVKKNCRITVGLTFSNFVPMASLHVLNAKRRMVRVDV